MAVARKAALCHCGYVAQRGPALFRGDRQRAQCAGFVFGLSIADQFVRAGVYQQVLVVGAGGIGATLNTALSRYEYDSAAAVLLIVIAIVLGCEYASGAIRARAR